MTKKSIPIAKQAEEGANDSRLVKILQGQKFTAYSLLAVSGKDVVHPFLQDLASDLRAKFFALLKMIVDHGYLQNPQKCKSVREGIVELKVWGVRVYSFRDGDRIILTNGEIKKSTGTTSKLENAIDSAVKAKRRYLEVKK